MNDRQVDFREALARATVVFEKVDVRLTHGFTDPFLAASRQVGSTSMIMLMVQVLGAWFVGGALLLLFTRGAVFRSLWKEPVLKCPVVIVESDDWGAGPVQDAIALDELAKLLDSIRDETGNPAVMTLGVVLGQPDGPYILDTGLSMYRRRTLLEPLFGPIVGAMRAGCADGVFSLQWHGLEHCWPESLLARARHEPTLQRWLADPDARSEALPPELQSRWVDTAELPSHPLAKADVQAAVALEAAMLQEIFGEVPTVAVPNTFVWNDDVEQAWVSAGVTCIVTPGRRFEGRTASGALQPPTRIVRNGDRCEAGEAVFVVRDDYFEPIRGHRAEQVWAAVARKVSLGRPVLLETHRESFVATPAAGREALHELKRALCGALERYPDTRFMPTVELAAHLVDETSSLRERSFSRKLVVFLGRVQEDAALARYLKFSGLSVVCRLAARIAASVTHGRCAALSR